MRTRWVLAPTVALCAIAAPGACTDDPPPAQESDIIGGEVADDPAYDAVGVFLLIPPDAGSGGGGGSAGSAGDGGSGGAGGGAGGVGGGAAAEGATLDPFCTGTLIAPDVVLTAKHCIDDHPPERLRFGIGPDGWAPDRIYEVASISLSSPVFAGDDAQSKGDVGVVTLTAPVEGIDPLPVAKLAPEDVGGTFTVIGYGFSNPEETEKGQRKKGSSTLIALVDAYLATVGDEDDTVVCRGDSGSPLLQEIDGQLTVFGVAATTSVATGVCSNPATYQRFTSTECPGGIADGQITCVEDAITRCDVGAVPGSELKTLIDCSALTPKKACIGKSCATFSSE